MRVWRRERLWVHRQLPQRVAGAAVVVALSAQVGLAGGPMPHRQDNAVSAPSQGLSVPVTAVPLTPTALNNRADKVAKPTATHWPAASAETLDLAAPSGSGTAAVKPGTLGRAGRSAATPVSLQAVADGKGLYAGPGSARVTVLSREDTSALGVSGLVFTIAGASTTPGRVKVGLDYQAFAQAYGGNYGSRLALVELPACALTTPKTAACRRQTPLGSENQASAQQVSATIELGSSVSSTAPHMAVKSNAATAAVGAASTMVLAATASSGSDGSGAGTYAATSLKSSESWNEGGDSGSYDYTYPISVPGASSSLAPSLALSYSSQSLDGQTAASNAQSSWVGDGWGTPDSFVEQSFASCSDSPEGVSLPSSEATGDECYDGPILSVSLDGSSTSLVCNAAETQCTEQSDTGDVVTHVTGADNGSKTYNTDYWKITDRSGKSYYFGLNELPGYVAGKSQATNSVDYEPVYSPNSGDPCYNDTFTSAVCTMAYRWHLDYVTNTTGQAMAYYYSQSTNEYGEDNGAQDVSYISDSYIAEIDYGFAAGGAYGTVPDKVVFTPAANGRCVQTSCTSLTDPSMTATLAATDDPDVPYDLICGPGTNETTCDSYGPSFFSVNRLGSIETFQYSTAASAPEAVDLYTLTQTEPTTGDTTNSTLWLESVQHEGMDTSGGASSSGISMPSETFAGTPYANRVDDATYPALYRYRLTGIVSELGATTTIAYSTPDGCSDAYVTAETAADAETNTKSCYPVYWTPPGYSGPILDWFNSWAVKSVIVTDLTGGGMPQETDYSYNGGAAWHYDNNELVKAKYRTYGQFRGYANVTTYSGQTLNNPQTESTSYYYRGMDGNWSIASGSAVSKTVTDTQGGVHTDSAELAGQVLETVQNLGSGGPVEEDSITSYWVSDPVQTRTRSGLDALNARATGVAEVWDSKTNSDGDANTVTETDTSYDATTTDADFGLPQFAYTHTVPAQSAFDSCTTTQYAPPNTAANIVGLVAYTEADQVACGGFTEGSAPSVPAGFNKLLAPSSVTAAQVASATQTFYDDTTFSLTFPQTAAPTEGLVTMVRQAKSGTPGSFTWQTQKRDTYDSYGRVVDAYDANGNDTVTSYVLDAVGLTTGMSVAAPTVNGVAHTTSETLDPTRGLVLTATDQNNLVTTATYDALGRTVNVWKNNRATTFSPSIKYAYTVSSTGISGVTTQTINDAGAYNMSVTIDDSLGRTRQTQSPSPATAGGRLITDTWYDSRGWVWKTSTNYYDSTTPPSMVLDTADTDNLVPNQDEFTYDGLGRQVQDISRDDANTVTTATTVYNGDETTVFPPTDSSGKTTGTVKTTVTDALGHTSKLIEYSVNPTLNVPSNTFTGAFTISGGTPVTTAYQYDAQGKQDQTTAAGEVWSATYDLLGRETSSTDPDAGTSTMQYDNDGNLTQTEDAEQHYLSYTYDALGRKTAEYAAATSSQPNNKVASWAYDAVNGVSGVTGVTDAVGQTTTSTSYDASGNAYIEQSLGFNNFGESLGTEVVIPSTQNSLLAKTWKFTSTYSGTIGLLTGTTFPSGGGLPSETTAPTYTTGLDLENGLGGTLSGYDQGTTYDAWGHAQVTTLGSTNTAQQATITDTYDPHTSALTQQLVKRSTTTPTNVDQLNYTYSPAGLITRETDTRLGASATAETQCFTYTTQDQLSQAWTATDNCAATPSATSHTTVGDLLASTSAYDEAWTYNTGNGEQTGETQYSTATGQTKTVTDNYNENAASSGDSQPTTLTSTTTVVGSTTTPTTYKYTVDGQQKTRQTSTGSQTLTWDNQGQLIEVDNSTSGSTSKYTYDASGGMLLQSDGANTTLYLPGEQITVNTSTSSVVSADRYYSLPGGATVVRTGTGTNYDFEIASDQHGTNTLYLDYTCQNPTWRQQDPYGNARGTAQTWIDNHGFLNDPTDAATALTNVGARWYDPTTGSFVSLDPVLETNDPTQLGGYDYSGGDPVSASDPTGDNEACTDGPGSLCTTDNGTKTTGSLPTVDHTCDDYPSLPQCKKKGKGTTSGNTQSTLPPLPKGYHWEQCTVLAEMNINGCIPGSYYLALNYVVPVQSGWDEIFGALSAAGGIFVATVVIVAGCNPASDAFTGAASCVVAVSTVGMGLVSAPGAGDAVGGGAAAESDLLGEEGAANEAGGYAEVFLDDAAGHASISVTYGNKVPIHTEAGAFEGADSIVRFRTTEPSPGTDVITVQLPNAKNAYDAANALEGSNLGPHDNNTNNCVTYCGIILNAGGANIPDDNSQTIAGYLLNSDYPRRAY